MAVLCVGSVLSGWAITSSYYSSLDGKSGATLFSAVGTVANTGYAGTLTYSGLWTAYTTIDLNSSGKIWDIYSNCSFTKSTDQCGTYSNVCDCYNREHSLPQNWFGSDVSNSSKGVAGTDMFHIYPTDGKVNGMRSNYPYGETSSGTTYGTGRLGNSTLASSYTYNGNTYTTTSYSGTVFEPADDYKGDLARTYFYMIAFWGKYKGTSFAQGTYGSVHFNTTYTSAGGYGLTAYSIGLLMKWHRQDPVSQKEIDRNNALQNLSGQGNRNPFIDYPCLAEYFWGDKKDQTFNLSSVKGSFESGFSIGSCDGCSTSCSGGSSTTNYTLTWKVNGSQWASTTSSGSSVSSLPTLPTSSNCDGSKVFVGWSKTKISTATNTVPSDLFTAASGAPSITGVTTFYAVFATASSSGSSGSETLSCSAGTISNNSMSFSTTNFSIVHAKGSGSAFAAYSPWRVYAGNTVTISGSKSITSVVITCGSSDYATVAAASTLSASGGGSVTASASSSTCTITATGTVNSLVITPNGQTRWSSIVINYGSATTYSGYITECSSSSCTTNPTVGAGSVTSGSVTTSGAGVACTSGITSLGSSGCSITGYGFVYSTSSNPTITTGTVVQVGTSYTSTGTAFSTSLSGLNASTTYYVRPYATNGNGTAYGSQTSFTTKTPTSYTVTWKVNGSTYTTGNPTTSVTEGGQVSILPTDPSAPTACSDKEFVGWSATDIGSTATNTAPTDLFTTTSASPTINADTTFYAVFADAGSGGSSGTASFAASDFSGQGTANTGSAISATKNGVTFACDKGYGTTQIRCYSGGVISISSSNTITALAFTFSGTYTGGMSTSYTGLSTTNWTQSLTSQARFTAITVTYGGGISYSNYVTRCAAAVTYTITWNATTNGGTCSTGTSTVTAGNAIGTLPTATKAGHTFDGWFTASTGGTQITATTVPTGNATYYAQFTPNTYTVTYNKGTYGVGTNTSDTKTYGVALSLKGASFTRDGYTQTGWASNAAGTTYAYDLGASYTANAAITLYPYWTALPTYTVTFKNGTATYDTKTGYEGQMISVSTPSACDGFTFVGWSTQQYSSTNTTTPTIDYTGTVPSSNTTYYAVFSRQGNASTSPTNNYARISSASDLTNGNYVVAAYSGGSYYAITNTVTNTNYLSRTQVTPSSNTISSPAASIIWQISVSGSTITLYNAAVSKYMYASTTALGLNSTTSNNTSFTASLSGTCTLTSVANTNYKIRYSTSRFSSSTTATSLYLYKQQEETTYTTYYTTNTQLTVTVNSNDANMGTASAQAL